MRGERAHAVLAVQYVWEEKNRKTHLLTINTAAHLLKKKKIKKLIAEWANQDQGILQVSTVHLLRNIV